jgi:peroxiredoxin
MLVLGLMVGLPEAKAGPEADSKNTVYDKAGDWSFKTLDGKTTAFSDFRGKVVFLNFWATWCVPCVEEMPGIQRLISTMKDHDVAFVLVTDEKEEKVRKFLEKHRLDLPIYIRSGKAPKTFKTKRLPITYILDRGGKIAMRRTGSTEWDDSACQDFIRGLAKASPK